MRRYSECLHVVEDWFQQPERLKEMRPYPTQHNYWVRVFQQPERLKEMRHKQAWAQVIYSQVSTA